MSVPFKNLREWVDAITYAFELIRNVDRCHEGVRLFLNAAHGMVEGIDDDGQPYLINEHEGQVTFQLRLPNREIGDEFFTIMNKYAEQFRSLNEDFSNSDFGDEYEARGKIARSKVFNTYLPLTAINALSERVASGYDDPEGKVRIVERRNR